VHQRQPPRIVVLDMALSESPTYGEQEGSAYNGLSGVRAITAVVSNQPGVVERCALRSCNSADGWRGVLEPVVARYRVLGPAQPLRLEAPRLAGRGGRLGDRPATHNALKIAALSGECGFQSGRPVTVSIAITARSLARIGLLPQHRPALVGDEQVVHVVRVLLLDRQNPF